MKEIYPLRCERNLSKKAETIFQLLRMFLGSSAKDVVLRSHCGWSERRSAIKNKKPDVQGRRAVGYSTPNASYYLVLQVLPHPLSVLPLSAKLLNLMNNLLRDS